MESDEVRDMTNVLENPFRDVLAGPPPLAMSPENSALVVVDMQYFDAHPEWGEGRTAIDLGVAGRFDDYFAQIDAIMPQIQALLALFRRKEMEIIHLRVAEVTNDSRDVGWKQLVRGLVVPANSKEADPLDEVAPVNDEIVVSKSSSGVFPVTNLDRLLRNMEITTLIFTGTSTGGCVESAVRDAVDLGYDVVVVGDACACSTKADHQRALARMEGGLTRVMTTREVAELVASLPAGDRRARSGLERVKAFLPAPPPAQPAVDVNPYALIFPPAIDLDLSVDNSALLLIDAQRLTCDVDCGVGRMARERGATNALDDYFDRVDQALTGMQRLLADCRALHLPVIHVRTAGRQPDGRDLSRKTRSQGIQIGPESPEAEFMPQAAPQSG